MLGKVALFGAGQAGAMVARLMGPGHSVCCVADNDGRKWGGSLCGAPVVPPERALEYAPESFIICVMGEERSAQMEGQLRELGYAGPVLRTSGLGMLDARSAVMRLLAEQMELLGIEGDVAELGVYRGEFAAQLNAAFPERRLHLFDTFGGFAEEDVEVERREGFSAAGTGDFSGTDVELVRAALPHAERALFHVGHFPETFEPCRGCVFALVSIDADLYAPTAAALPLFWERLSLGGALLVHDVNGSQFAGAGRAVEEFCRARGLLPTPLCDLHGTVLLRKT